MAATVKIKANSYVDYRAQAEIAGIKPPAFVTNTPANRKLRALVNARKAELLAAAKPARKASAKKAA